MTAARLLKEGRRILGLRPRKHRLGRHIKFDSRSHDHRVQLGEHQQALVSKLWARKVPSFDQGAIGSCTGNGCAGVLATEPVDLDGVADNVDFVEDLAVKIYTRASQIDEIEGQYPEQDTGSTVLAVMKAAKEMGLISGYRWCMGIDDVLRTLSNVGPVEVGVSWLSGFDNPDASGRVQLVGSDEGGHAFELHGIDVERELVWAYNSWGPEWGAGGRFCFGFEDLRKLLKHDGEAVMVLRPGESGL